MKLTNKDRLIIAQNQSNSAVELTKLSCQFDVRPITDKELLRRFIFFRTNIMNDILKRYDKDV